MSSPSNQRWQLSDIPVPLDDARGILEAATRTVAHRLNLNTEDVEKPVIEARSIDSRRKRPRFRVTLSFGLGRTPSTKKLKQLQIRKERIDTHFKVKASIDQPRPVVIGAGPAGIFAAYTLAEAGLKPIIIERGRAVEKRGRDVSGLYSKGILNPESNVCFGEGGAGTYSDGKLYTRVTDGRVRRLYQWMVKHGAPEDILVNTKPHVGTDKLVKLLRSVRAYLESLGAEYHFETKCVGLELREQTICGIRATHLGTEKLYKTDHVICATGHSAHDMWKLLEDSGAQLEARPFAVGFRIEHPQALIDEARYGMKERHPELPASDYRLAYTEPDGAQRGIYSFCMCPGGVVVTTPTVEGGLCINGMSHAARSGRFANSAMVVTVGPEDFAREGFHGTFAGVEFQRQCEERAYQRGNGSFQAPSLRVTDYLNGTLSQDLPASSYRRGLVAAKLDGIYPSYIDDSLRNALTKFEDKLPGFLSSEAKLIGVETRTASPIRVLRHKDTLQTNGIVGLYPVGEGMGYGGGIASAALDGIRSAEALLKALGAEQERVVQL